MSYVIMTAKEWADKLIYLARQRSTYLAEFPYNLLYFRARDKRWFADCSNLEKALFNGRDIYNPTDGSYAWPLPATGDATEYALYMQCSDRSGNFKNLKKNEPRLLYMEGHIGAFVGDEWNEPNQGIVNCVECTPAWEDGIQFSYVDDQGRRYWCKGAAQRGTWEGHGLASKWVDYSDASTQEVIEESKKEVAEDVTDTHYDTVDLAVMFIRNKFGNGYQNRLSNCLALGYTESEVRAAQDYVNSIVKKANEQKLAAEQELVISTASYDVIAGLYGDGSARRNALIDKFGEEMQPLIQARVEDLIS